MKWFSPAIKPHQNGVDLRFSPITIPVSLPLLATAASFFSCGYGFYLLKRNGKKGWIEFRWFRVWAYVGLT